MKEDSADTRADPSSVLRRLLTFEAVLGLLPLCAPSSWIQSAFALPLVERLVLCGVLTVAPLAAEAGLRDAGPSWPRRHAWAVAILSPLCGLSAFASLFFPIGSVSGALAAAWLVPALLIAGLGLRRLMSRGGRSVAEFSVDIGHLYLPVGAAWLFASRFGLRPMGFGAVITALTAAHFHFAGLAAPVVVGQIGRLLGRPSRVYAFGALVVAATPILVALGIVGSPILEASMALLLALGVLSVASVSLLRLLPRALRRGLGPVDRVAYLLLGLAQAVAFGTMALAALYAVGELLERPWIFIPTMARYHGFGNALGFAIPSLLALRWLAPRRDALEEKIPFQRLGGRTFIGPDFFDRQGLSEAAEAPRGLLTPFAKMRAVGETGPSFAPEVASFYEETADLILICSPRWSRPFARLGGIFVKLFARRIGQLVLPLEERLHDVRSQLRWLDEGRLGIAAPIASIRRYGDGGAMYVASYAHHRDARGRAYMNIALPLPLGSALLSNLWAERLGGELGGLSLSTCDQAERGHEGIWLRLFGSSGPLLRLPLHETLIAWPAKERGRIADLRLPEQEGDLMIARHSFTLLGFGCLEIDYRIRRDDR